MLFGAQKRGQNTPRMSLRVHFSLLYCPKMVPNGPKMAPQASLSTLGSCSGSLNRIWVFWGPKKTQNSTRAIFRAQTVQILKWGPKNPHMGLELQNSFKEVARGAQYGKLTGRHQGFRKYVSPNQTRPVFWENVIFSAQGAPRKSWGTYFYVKSKNNWGPLSSLFSILAIKMHFWPFYS